MVVPLSAPDLKLKFGRLYPVLASEFAQITSIRCQSNVKSFQNMSQVAAILDGGGGATGPGGGGGGGGGTGACGGGSGSGGGRRRALAHNNMIFPRKQNMHNHKHGRKRLQSGGDRGGKFHIPHKKRRKDGHIPPTKFLLGGNICDPLNLGSLQDEEINRAMNAVTPKSSPIPTPKHRKGEVEVIIPPNINDPLNLNSCEDEEEYMAQLANSGGSPVKKAHRNKSKRKKKRLSAISNSSKGEENADGQTSLDKSGNLSMTSDSGETGPDNTSPLKERTLTATLPVNLGENAAQGGGDSTEAAAPEPAKTHESPMKRPNRRSEEGAKERRPRKMDLKDKIVSPVIWQPGQKHVHGHHGHHGHGHHGHTRNQKFKEKRNSCEPKTEPKFRAKDVSFQYGNFNRYYGYRNPSSEPDLRLRCFAEYPELFRDRDVLDIGCNVGHITLSIGRDFRARSVVGIDIDRKLIEIARKNVRHYVNYEQSPAPTAAGTPSSTPSHCTPSYTSSLGIQSQMTAGKDRSPHDRFFPISMPIVYGPIDIPGITDGIRTPRPASAPLPFPKNISFVQGNYVLDSDSLLALEQPQFDVILCLSITKWFHLNWGDAGLKRAFRRMYLQLRPGGCLILEPQGWPSYNRKKKLTATIWKNYNSIEFFPNQFREYLLSPEVGFSHCRILDIPQHSAKGFRRPITMFVKGDPSPAHSALSIDSSTVLRPTVYAQTSCDGASPMSGTPDPLCGQNLPCTSPGAASFTPDNQVASPMTSGHTPKYQYASPGPSSFTPDHPIASPVPSGTTSGPYCASPMSGGYTPDPQSASPAQSCLTPDYAGASPMPAGLTPDPRSLSPGSMTPDPRSTSPFPSGLTSDFQSASPTGSFAPDTQGASCDTSDGEATRFETLDSNQTKTVIQGTLVNEGTLMEKPVTGKTEELERKCDVSKEIGLGVLSGEKGNQDLTEGEGDWTNDSASSAVGT
ncbi:7SK snRNA methylphosphate capping enzyme-like isoform X2 [Frankliniella occidentalis]|uniref:RNA methyltransferase n=1 Tax=Frankliniella occidentalis TaxID=133901 RepID=A0A9C6X1R7_FRAOC|nr:7SK snRNA methylphosphate capping enzyme-like isoform X2 [Frankliniella occidentalis]